MLDQTPLPRKKIAVIGGGISGMSAAYYLAPGHDVTLYEAAPRLGGHARTVIAGQRGDQPVDTGFIVFNYATYPNLTRLFRDLDVPVAKSEMSFGVSIDDGRLEYGLNRLESIVAQRRNVVRPQYYKMIADIVRFGRRAEAAAEDDGKTIGDLVDELGLGAWFKQNYLLPMCGAIWSTPTDQIDQFPARSLVRFLRNHALLAGIGKHQWWTVDGGSIEYVRRLEAALVARMCRVRKGTPVAAVTRRAGGVTIRDAGGQADMFDDVILACHSDQALALLGGDARPDEAATLGAMRYQTNRAVLHCDPAQMPRRRGCWASWIYRAQEGSIGVTYWMNRLQNIPEDDPMFVTLNPVTEIPQHMIYDSVEFAHPIFDRAAIAAQGRLQAMQGQNRTWFAGAYCRNGFHEDGIASAMRVVRGINRTSDVKGAADASDEQGAEIEISRDLRTSA